MQVLDLSLSVGSVLPVPMTACIASAVDAGDLSSCSVLVYDNNAANHFLTAGSSLSFKAAVHPSCNLERVYAGLCSACTAAAASAGTCPPGTHAFILDIDGPVGLEPSTMLGMVFHVGASLLSAEVLIQFEVDTDTRGDNGTAAKARKTLQSMLEASKV
jgi:hypothetical protein